MIFSNDLVIKARNAKIVPMQNNKNNISSFFIESLSHILESNNKVNSIIYESTNFNIDIDYKSKIISIFKEFVFSINDSYDAFRDAVESGNYNNSNYDFSNTACEYTNLGTYLGNETFRSYIDNDYRILIDYLNKLSDKTSIHYIIKHYIDNRVFNTEDELNKIRINSIGTDTSKESYGSDLYTYFRPQEPVANTDNEMQIKNIILYRKKEASDLVSAAQNIIEKIKELKIPESLKEDEIYKEIMVDYIRRSQETCNIYLQKYTATLDASLEFIAYKNNLNNEDKEDMIL